MIETTQPTVKRKCGRPRKNEGVVPIPLIPNKDKYVEPPSSELNENLIDSDDINSMVPVKSPESIILKTWVSTFYQIQKMRVAIGNRIFAVVTKSIGVEPGTSPYKEAESVDGNASQHGIDDDRPISEAIDDDNDGLLTKEQEEEEKQKENIVNEVCKEYMKITTLLADLVLTDSELNELRKMKLNATDVVRFKGVKMSHALNQVFKHTDTVHFEYIRDPAVYYMARQYVQLLNIEADQKKRIEEVLEGFPIYTRYLKYVKGCGVLMSACLIAKVNIDIASTVSKLWAYVGLDVAPDGRGRGKYAEHLIERTYINASGKEDTRLSTTYNPWLKTKMVGVLGTCLMRQNPAYRAIYQGYKNRITNDPKRQGTITNENGVKREEFPKLRIHRMAIRYMVKMFLLDVWVHWRALEGLDLTEPYQDAKLDIESHFRTLDLSKINSKGVPEFVEIYWNQRKEPHLLCSVGFQDEEEE